MPLLNDQKWPRAAGRFPKANRTGRLPVTRGDSQGWNDDAGWFSDSRVSGSTSRIADLSSHAIWSKQWSQVGYEHP